ncbi:MAG TPA: hypothetical protein DGG94_09750 [Micromonosporaceae bacterium]|nr:hypothetical protein [Micromonosporaceae bacterium]HCU50067.1 hypothetical protein [Micromonosporaceae bacterium]
MSAAAHDALAFGPFSPVQAEIDYNLAVLRRTRIVAWDCSTMTLQIIRDGLANGRHVDGLSERSKRGSQPERSAAVVRRGISAH